MGYVAPDLVGCFCEIRYVSPELAGGDVVRGDVGVVVAVA
jgi:hypothetical protein